MPALRNSLARCWSAVESVDAVFLDLYQLGEQLANLFDALKRRIDTMAQSVQQSLESVKQIALQLEVDIKQQPDAKRRLEGALSLARRASMLATSTGFDAMIGGKGGATTHGLQEIVRLLEHSLSEHLYLKNRIIAEQARLKRMQYAGEHNLGTQNDILLQFNGIQDEINRWKEHISDRRDTISKMKSEFEVVIVELINIKDQSQEKRG